MLEIRKVRKEFPGVIALDDVSITFKPGEIHALLGENGAGKSTLMKIICGIYKADEGEVLLDGEPLHFKSFKDALEHKITIVNQEIQVIPSFNVAENIIIDKTERFSKHGIMDWKKANAVVREALDKVGLKDLDYTVGIAGLSAGQKQMIQIAKCITADAKVILFDEPTSALSESESQVLFGLIRKLRDEGMTIIFVSHKLDEVMELCDCISILRDGKMIGTRRIADIEKSDIIEMMVGRKLMGLSLGALTPDYNTKVLEVHDVCQAGTFDHLSFDLYKGEILGFYGLVGSGRTELAKIIIGEDKTATADIRVNGKAAKIHSVGDAIEKYRLGYCSENRREEGLLLEDSVMTNIAITMWKKLANNPIRKISVKKEKQESQKMVDLFGIRISSLKQAVEGLSGGNQQKVLMSKWLAAGCDILIIDEPTIGVDVAAKAAIHRQIWNLAKEEGKTILLISSDMEEMCTLARRIMVFRDFAISGEIDDICDGETPSDVISRRIGQMLM